MAMSVPLGKSIRVFATSDPRQAQAYEGSGDSRRVVGRLTNSAGEPLSRVSIVAATPTMGLLGDATLEAPDTVLEAVPSGSFCEVAGDLSARLVGGDFGTVRATVQGAHQVKGLGSATELMLGKAGQ